MSSVDPSKDGAGQPARAPSGPAPVKADGAGAPAPAEPAPKPVAAASIPANVVPATAKPAVPAAPPVPPPPPPPNPLPHLPLPFTGVDFSARGVNAEAAIPPEQVVEAARVLDREGFAIDTITGVDWMAQNQMEVVYDFFHATKPLRVALRTRVPRENPEVPTISQVFPGADWHERETHDFFGIRFAGHPDLSPFLLPEDADYHPLRKDFKA